MKRKETELDKKESDDRKEGLERRRRPSEVEELGLVEEEEGGLLERPPRKYIFIAAGALAFIIMALFLTWFLLSGDKTTTEQGAVTDTLKEEPSLPEVILFTFEPFFIPLKDSSKEKDFLKFKMSAELGSPELKREMNLKLPTLRNSIVETVMRKSKKNIKDQKGRERLKNEIKEQLNFSLKSGEIKEIYFSQFMIQ